MDKLSLAPSGAYPGMPKGNAGAPQSVPPGAPPPVDPMGAPGMMPGGEEGSGAPDLANIFLEWGYGKAAEAAAGGNPEAGDMISQGIDMVLQGIQGMGGGMPEGGEGPLPMPGAPGQAQGIGGLMGSQTPTSGGRVPFGQGGGVPMNY